jgi:hypothetical protein
LLGKISLLISESKPAKSALDEREGKRKEQSAKKAKRRGKEYDFLTHWFRFCLSLTVT